MNVGNQSKPSPRNPGGLSRVGEASDGSFQSGARRLPRLRRNRERVKADPVRSAAVHAHRTTAPDLALYRATRERRDTTVARLTVARKIGKRAFHALRELELATTQPAPSED